METGRHYHSTRCISISRALLATRATLVRHKAQAPQRHRLRRAANAEHRGIEVVGEMGGRGFRDSSEKGLEQKSQALRRSGTGIVRNPILSTIIIYEFPYLCTQCIQSAPSVPLGKSRPCAREDYYFATQRIEKQ